MATCLDRATDDVDDLMLSSVRERLRVIGLALGYKNGSVAKKHILRLEQILPLLKGSHDKLYTESELLSAKYKYVMARSARNTRKKLEYFLSSWQIARELSERERVNYSVIMETKHHLFDLSSMLVRQAESDSETYRLLSTNDFVCATLNNTNDDLILDDLKRYGFEKLRESCLTGDKRTKGESFAKFGRHCYDLMQSSKELDSKLIEHLVDSILSGMIEGSTEAARYFPCLFKSKLYAENEQIQRKFSSKAECVQSWMFLSCKDQILSYLSDQVLKGILLPVIKRLSDDYPFAIVYDYNQLPESVKSDDSLRAIGNLFHAKVEVFVEEMHRVCQPELYMRQELQRLHLPTSVDFHQNVGKLLSRLYGEHKQQQQQGKIWEEHLVKYKEAVEKLKDMRIKLAKEHVRQMREELKLNMKKRLRSGVRQALQLKDYSPRLAYFSGTNQDAELEIPGQYDGSSRPMPEYHIKIAKFDRFVRVMDSMWNPIKIVAIGNDAKSYGYLVKCGEDLRQDQRLQQIFKTTNRILDSDVSCKRRHLFVNTFHVQPLSSYLGLIQWIDGAKSLREFVEFSLKDKDILKQLADEYNGWIQKAGSRSVANYIECYKESLVKYGTQEVVTKMTKLTDRLGCDLLKKTFAILSPSLECFVSLRHNFVMSYATMCTIHWLTGVGDRHLENLLIKVKSGECWGIDFGLAFGSGIDQSIPELVPFRLTSQILGLLKPFDENALFGMTMTHVLGALRNDRGPLTACLDVFLHEPLDWTQNINKNIREEEQEKEDDAANSNKNSLWVPQIKVETAKQKLNGEHPSKIMLEELSVNHHDQADVYFPRYKVIVNGEDYPDSMRLKLSERDVLTPEEQVQCLLEMAKDFSLLGRMYVGWHPFV